MVGDRWITDWAPSEAYPVYTRANAGEVLPDPASPLAWTLYWMPGIVMGWRDCQVRVGTVDDAEIDARHPEVVGLFGGYLYINASMARLFGVRAPGLSAEMIDFVYFGEHPDVPPYTPEPWHESEPNTAKLAAWMGHVMTVDDLPGLRDDRDAAAAARSSRPDLGSLTDDALVARARSFVPLVRRLFDVHLEMTAATSIGPGVLTAIATAMGDPSLALKLITAVGDIDSAAPSHALWALSRLDPATSEYRAAFAAFIAEYGSRGPNEWDIRSDTWETNPDLATALVDVMRPSPDGEAPDIRNQRNAAEREAITASLRAALADQPEVLGQFEAGLRSAHLYMSGRERAKTNIIKVVHEIRMAIRELAGRHDLTMSQACMLLDDELDAFVNDPGSMRARLAQRERQYLELFEMEPPFILNGMVPALGEWPRRGADVAARAVTGDELAGVPGAPGVAEGIARVVLDPGDPFALEPGDVLVAPITDPAWTPLFVPAAAVIVNVGAQVSHAVIVSRELGIPCVVSVQGATERIADGSLVRVDGNTGTVTVL